MKRILFVALTLSVALTAACKPEAGNNANQGVGYNANQGTTINTNINAGIVAFDKDDKALAVTLHVKEDGTKEILVAEQKIKLKKGTQKLRFIVINNLGVDVGDVTMPFTTTDPFDGSPFVAKGPTKSGEIKETQTRKAKNATGTYKYSIVVTGTDGKPLPGLPPLDPQVEIVD